MTQAGQGPSGAPDGGPQELPPLPTDEDPAPGVVDSAAQPAAGGDAAGPPAQGEGAPDSQ